MCGDQDRPTVGSYVYVEYVYNVDNQLLSEFKLKVVLKPILPLGVWLKYRLCTK